MTKNRLSECICLSSGDKLALRTALNRAIGVVEKGLKEEEKEPKGYKVLLEFYKKDLIAYSELHNRIDEIPDCP